MPATISPRANPNPLPFPGRPITVALAGNPNCGKTTLFNRLTGSRQHVGNFSGVTVTKKEGTVLHRGRLIRLIDLPGTYSLSSNSIEEVVARRHILEEQPDLVLNVLDAGNLERNLFLTTQLIELGRPRIYCLNMIDEARAKGLELDRETFATLLDGPAVETVGRTGEGMEELLDAIVEVASHPFRNRRIHVPYDPHVEEAIGRLQHRLLEGEGRGPNREQARWLAIKLLEGDREVAQRAEVGAGVVAEAETERHQLHRQHALEAELLLADGRYGFIHGLLTETQRRGPPRRMLDLTRRVDDLLLNRWLGLPLFLFFMWVMFQATFVLGAHPADWIDQGVTGAGEWLGGVMSPGPLRDLMVDGVVAGIGSVLVFLPNIVLLFFFISLFEDSGYMARVAFLMDRVMHAIGLHGKAFIPLLMGFGCNVPAIMATRTMENPRDRLVTILVNPFMSCSARLPVFVLLGGAFFGEWAGTAVFLINLTGLLVAMGAALLLKSTLFRGLTDPFVMELPPYRAPTLRSVVVHMWERAVQFLKKVSGVILVGSILVWFSGAYPREVVLERDFGAEVTRVEQSLEGEARTTALSLLKAQEAAAEQERRYIGQVGHAIAPFFEPLGLDWKASVALLTGVVAKEVVVSTLGVLHHQGGEADEENAGLRQALRENMPLPAAVGFMVFSLLYLPCLSTVAVIRRETGSWAWTGFAMGFSLAVAWGLAWVAYSFTAWLI